MTSIWRHISRTLTSPSPYPVPAFVAPPRFFSSSSPYLVKVGIPEFLNGIGKGVEAHAQKLESEFGDLQKLLVVRTLKLKKLEIPCKHRKLILKYAHKYRVGLWRPRSDMVKV
ncbi:Flap endonuclease Xni [Bienertia sinuspersici]